jgi:hypothetical protein
MTEPTRSQVLEANKKLRQGMLTSEEVRALDMGYVAMRIPTKDWKVLRKLFPDLESKDHAVRLAAWKKLQKSPIGEPYLVTRTAKQVQANNHRIIVK